MAIGQRGTYLRRRENCSLAISWKQWLATSACRMVAKLVQLVIIKPKQVLSIFRAAPPPADVTLLTVSLVTSDVFLREVSFSHNRLIFEKFLKGGRSSPI